jgi:GNAT superfamily N-acetyltransferase
MRRAGQGSMPPLNCGVSRQLSERISSVNVSIRLTDQADPTVREAIVGSLIAYNRQQTGTTDHRPLVLAIYDENGKVIGGLWGRTAFGWLVIEVVFVPESLRGNGIGADLMSRAESEAIARGCCNAWLDTFEFQARGFYERLGYSCFGELKDYPVGFSRYFMKKVLTDGVPSG